MNFADVLFFQAELAPDKLALVAHGSIIPYGRLAQGILSVQQRLTALGMKEGQTVGVSLNNPIDHMVVVCALYRMRIASASINSNLDSYLDKVTFDALLADNLMMAAGLKQPNARLVLLDQSWFQDAVTLSVGDRSHGRRDQPLDWTARITCYPESNVGPALVRTSARALESQIITYCLSAPPLWDRMISIAGLQGGAGLVQAMSALWLGRSVCFADVHNVRSLSQLYRHDYLVAPAELAEPLIKLQEVDYASLHGLRAACFEGRSFSSSAVARGRSNICSQFLFRYTHPEVGVVAYGDTSRFKNIEGAVGFVAPWVEAQVVDGAGQPLPAGKEGTLRFRRRERLGVQAECADVEGWIYPRQRAVVAANNLLAIRAGDAA